MTSPPPLCYDAYYHIYNRGTNRENIFIEERNYAYFLALYLKHIEPIAKTFAYCLLRNHFHLLVRIKEEKGLDALRVSDTLKVSYPSKKFSDFFNAYAKAINKAYGRTGSLFQHPFGRVRINDDRHFWNVIAYIHQNPQKHKFVNDFREWKYSSYSAILSKNTTHLQRDEVLEWFGGPKQYQTMHAKWVAQAQSNWFAEDDVD